MKIYKITEASEYLGVSINTLKTLANNGYELRAALDKAQAIARNLSQNVRRAFEDGMNGDRRRCE